MFKIKHIFYIFLLVIVTCSISLQVSIAATKTNIHDTANLLSTEEEKALQEKIKNIKKRSRLTIHIELIKNLGTAKSPKDYCKKFYQKKKDANGTLMLVSMKERDIYLYTNGEVKARVSTDQLNAILDEITPLLSDEYFYKACLKYIEQVEADYLINPPSTDNINNSAGFLTRKECRQLQKKLEKVKSKHNLNIYLEFVDEVNFSCYDYCNNVFREHNEVNGAIMLLTRDDIVFLYGNGAASRKLTNEKLNIILKKITPLFDKGKYLKACNTYIDDVVTYYTTIKFPNSTNITNKAGYLSEPELETLQSAIDSVKAEDNVDIYIESLVSLDDVSLDTYADNFFKDKQGNGILLLTTLKGEISIYTLGDIEEKLSYSQLSDLRFSKIDNKMENAQEYEAFDFFIQYIDKYYYKNQFERLSLVVFHHFEFKIGLSITCSIIFFLIFNKPKEKNTNLPIKEDIYVDYSKTTITYEHVVQVDTTSTSKYQSQSQPRSRGNSYYYDDDDDDDDYSYHRYPHDSGHHNRRPRNHSSSDNNRHRSSSKPNGSGSSSSKSNKSGGVKGSYKHSSGSRGSGAGRKF